MRLRSHTTARRNHSQRRNPNPTPTIQVTAKNSSNYSGSLPRHKLPADRSADPARPSLSLFIASLSPHQNQLLDPAVQLYHAHTTKQSPESAMSSSLEAKIVVLGAQGMLPAFCFPFLSRKRMDRVEVDLDLPHRDTLQYS